MEKQLNKAWFGARSSKPHSAERPRVVAQSSAMRQALETVEIVAPTTANVLISGETGVGKEVIARAIHAMSERWNSKFLAVNCGAIPENLVESVLFGHERGAFTGAYEVHQGFFERADKGTLFLDEIDSLPLPAQARLLRVLQENEFERVGGKQSLSVDVRIVAAAGSQLDKLMVQGIFRRDLYYRLNVVPIHIPPLRERPEDIPPLAALILARLSEKYRKNPHKLSRRALAQLMSYEWPGNVRELENILERSFLFASGQVLEQVALPEKPAQVQPVPPQSSIHANAQAYNHWSKRRRYGPDGANNLNLWVLACMDERLPVDEALGIHVDSPAGHGDAHCFRNAGGIVTDDAIRSARLTCNFFGTKEIVIVQHTQCGMLSANAQDMEKHFRDKGIDPDNVTFDPPCPN